MTSRVRRLFAWLLLFAMALSSAAPSFASRVSPADLASLGICSLAAHAGDGAPQDDSGPLGSGLHHCPLCAPAAHAAIAPSLPAVRVAADEVPSFTPAFLPAAWHAPYRGAIWRPRGPPVRA